MVETVQGALADAALAADKGADLVEYRVDTLASEPGRIPELVERTPLPCIVTCRPVWEGGLYDGDEPQRITALEYAGQGEAKPAYIDIELAAYQRSANIRQKVGLVVDHPGQVRPTPTRLILSTHDFDGRPGDLVQRVEAMAASPACRVMKVAWRAESIADTAEAARLVGGCGKPVIALCMGDHGVPSRVLAKKFGAAMSFAALDAGRATAPGQPTVRQMLGLYRWGSIGAQTHVYGVVGDPVGHSLSPAIHNAGFDATGYDGVYLPLPVPAGYEAFRRDVGAWLDEPAMDFRGASVTIPHKVNLPRFVRERGGQVEPLADRIGAANTLARLDDGTLYAANTDHAAALDAVCDAMGIGRDAVRGKRVAVIGAGGVARAVVAGFAGYGATVVIYNRTLENAERLAASLRETLTGAAPSDGGASHGPPAPPGKIVAARIEKLCDSCCEVYINCTPVGMHPHTDASPIPNPETLNWGPGTVVFDTIYNPQKTQLLHAARAAGCTTVSGIEMFIRQAAIQFKIWTDHDAPINVFRDVVTQRLDVE